MQQESHATRAKCGVETTIAVVVHEVKTEHVEGPRVSHRREE